MTRDRRALSLCRDLLKGSSQAPFRGSYIEIHPVPNLHSSMHSPDFQQLLEPSDSVQTLAQPSKSSLPAASPILTLTPLWPCSSLHSLSHPHHCLYLRRSFHISLGQDLARPPKSGLNATLLWTSQDLTQNQPPVSPEAHTFLWEDTSLFGAIQFCPSRTQHVLHSAACLQQSLTYACRGLQMKLLNKTQGKQKRTRTLSQNALSLSCTPYPLSPNPLCVSLP